MTFRVRIYDSLRLILIELQTTRWSYFLVFILSLKSGFISRPFLSHSTTAPIWLLNLHFNFKLWFSVTVIAFGHEATLGGPAEKKMQAVMRKRFIHFSIQHGEINPFVIVESSIIVQDTFDWKCNGPFNTPAVGEESLLSKCREFVNFPHCLPNFFELFLLQCHSFDLKT